MKIVRTMGTVFAAAALCLGGVVVAAAGTANADAAAGKRCQGEQLENVWINDEFGHLVGRVQRFREPSKGNCAEIYTNLGAGAAMTVFVIIKGHVKLVHGGSTALRWPAQKGCVTLGGTVNDTKGSAPACG